MVVIPYPYAREKDFHALVVLEDTILTLYS